MLTLFERLLFAITRVFPVYDRPGKVGSRREFLSSALRVGVGLATLQLGAVVRPAGVKGAGALVGCDPLGPGPCGGCVGCECCTSNVWFECEPASGSCAANPPDPCWPVGETGVCCDYCCPEGFCCHWNTFE